MSNAKKHKRWVDEVIKGLEMLGLEVIEDRQKKHRVVKGLIEGKPFTQTFSSTPKSYVSAARNILRETRKKLVDCGVEVEKVKAAMPTLGLLTMEMIEQEKREKNYKAFIRRLSELEQEIDFDDLDAF